MRNYLAIVFVTAAVLNLAQGKSYNLADGLLSCDNDVGKGQLLQFQSDLFSHVVWTPQGSGRSDGFKDHSYTINELKSIYWSIPGIDVDLHRQSLITPTNSAPKPKVSATVSVDEVFPDYSPFLEDQTILSITELELRNSVFSVGIGQCSLVSKWVDLGEFFFPRYYAGSRCEFASCSVPSGLSCHPDITANPDYLFALNWDCCNVNDMYTCGWRKVRIPVLTFCACACSPILE